MNDKDKLAAWLQVHHIQAESGGFANSQGEQALILAARQGREDIVGQLLQIQADLTVLDQYGNNALWAACFAEAAGCIDLLLQAGIDIDYQNPSGASALVYAASSGKTGVVEQLLQAGANPLLTTQDDFSAVDLAANRQCLQLLRTAAKALA